MKKLCFMVIMFGVCTFSSRATENHKLLANLEIKSLTVAAENIGKLMDDVSPGSSAWAGIMISAISLTPMMKPFDLSAPIQVCLYSHKMANGKSFIASCAVLRLNGKQTDKFVADKQNKRICMKRFGDYVLLTESHEFLNSFKNLPRRTDYQGDLFLEFSPELYITDFHDEFIRFKDMAVKDMAISSTMNHQSLVAFKVLKIKLEYLEQLLKMITRVQTVISFQHEVLLAHSTITPKVNSQFAEFVNLQTAKSKLSLNYAQQLAYGSTKLVLTDALKKFAIACIKNVYIEIADGFNRNNSLKIIEKLVANCSGNSWYASKFDQKQPLTLFRIECSPHQTQSIRTLLDKSGSNTLHKLNSRLFMRVGSKQVEFIDGELSEEKVRKLLTAQLLEEPYIRNELSKKSTLNNTVVSMDFRKKKSLIQWNIRMPFKGLKNIALSTNIRNRRPTKRKRMKIEFSPEMFRNKRGDQK